MTTKRIIPIILGKNNEYMTKYPIIGKGGFSVVYDLLDYPGFILKHSYIPNDGFRYLSSLSPGKRKKFGFRPIVEKKTYGDDMFFLMPKLYEVDFTLEELQHLSLLNSLKSPKDILNFSEEVSERILNIIEKLKFLINILATEEEEYELDITSENIMRDESGEIYLTDPIADFF